jgi:SAM-dependent methyltransferase
MTTKSPNPSATGRNWASPNVAEQWAGRRAHRDEIYGPATTMMLDLVNLQAGDRVLDVAAGTGDQTLMAARRVSPNGYVLATDLSAAMLNVAAEAARKTGLTNIETRVMNAESLDLDSNSFDAVICRLGLMLFSHPPKALREVRRVLKPGGKIAALVFSTMEQNPYQGIPLAIARGLGGITPPHFALGEPRLLRETFQEGGFPNVTVHAVSFQRHFSSAAEVIRSMRETIFLREAMANLDNSKREKAWAEIEEQLNRLDSPTGIEMPGELLIGVATK